MCSGWRWIIRLAARDWDRRSTPLASPDGTERPARLRDRLVPFRGGVAALDAMDGHLLWRSYTIPQAPQATGELNSAGAKRFHPAGAPVWNSPTIDVKRKRLYVGTGEAYTSPAAAQSDAVIAYEQGDWDQASETLQPIGVSEVLLSSAYTDALQWARQLSSEALAA